MSHVTPLFDTGPSGYRHVVVQKAADSWWVFRHPLACNGRPLPFSTVVLFARSRQDALDWIDAKECPDNRSKAA